MLLISCLILNWHLQEMAHILPYESLTNELTPSPFHWLVSCCHKSGEAITFLLNSCLALTVLTPDLLE